MVMNHTHDNPHSAGAIQLVEFAGDSVRLAGQIDYPERDRPSSGYPLIFIIQHSTCTSRADYQHISALGMSIGAVVFRWDKRGTGRSGNGSQGSVEVDTLKAYEFALSIPGIDPSRIVIFAQNEGTLILGQEYKFFSQLQKPSGIILAGNMLDENRVLQLDVPLHIVVSKNDWNDWRTYAEKAADTHAEKFNYEPSFYVATNTNRMLMYSSGNSFHRGAETSITHWLKHTCQIS